MQSELLAFAEGLLGLLYNTVSTTILGDKQNVGRLMLCIRLQDTYAVILLADETINVATPSLTSKLTCCDSSAASRGRLKGEVGLRNCSGCCCCAQILRCKKDVSCVLLSQQNMREMKHCTCSLHILVVACTQTKWHQLLSGI